MPTATGTIGVQIDFLDQNGNVIGPAVRDAHTSASWEQALAAATAPAGAVSVRLQLYADASALGAFDAIYARRKFDGGLVGAGSLGNAGLTYGNFDNLWPNPTSEASPPFVTAVLNDGSQPEWDYRKNLTTLTTQSGSFGGAPQTITVGDTSAFPTASTVKIFTDLGWLDMTYTGKTSTSFTGAGAAAGNFANGAMISDAYAGQWTRQIGPTANGATFSLKLPCGPDESYLLQAQAKRTAGAGNVGIQIDFQDVLGNSLQTTLVSSTTNAIWTALTATDIVAPAGTSFVVFRLVTTLSDTVGQFDQIFAARRMPGYALGGDAFGRLDLSQALSQARQDHAYSSSISLNAALYNEFAITATNGSAFTINGPSLGGTGQRITIRIRNASGGALGAVTWDASFKMAAWTSPANGFSRSIDFQYDGTNWIEAGRTAADVPN